MPNITLSARATVFQGDPNAYQEVKDATVLQNLNGIHSDKEVCSDYIDQELVRQLGLWGGRLRFYFDAETDQFRVSATYGFDRAPSDSEQERLLSETERQWSDGIGGGVFTFLGNEVLASSLALAIRHQDPALAADLPPYAVDAYPDGDRNANVVISDTGGPDDFLLQDLEHAANERNSKAQAELGHLYVQGEVVEGKADAGIKLLTQSADQDDEIGLIHLASAYLDGNHVRADPAKGVALYEKAIKGGSLLAMTCLAEAYKEGKGVPQRPDRAIEMLTEASNQGSPIAMAELGDCYEFGMGVDIDLPTALKWYEQALQAGFEPVEPAYKRVRGQLNRSASFLGRIQSFFTSLAGKSRDVNVDDEAVIMVQADDPEMQAAVAKAQATLNQFIEELRNPKPGDSAAVKVRFTDGPNSEFMWLADVQFIGAHFHGVLNNDPDIVKNVHLGDDHQAHPNDVSDWMISDSEGKIRGGYTIKVLRKRLG